MTDLIRYSYAMLRDDPMLALKVLLDSPVNPDPMSQGIEFNNVKVARQRLRAHLDDVLIAKAEAEDCTGCGGSGVVNAGSGSFFRCLKCDEGDTA